jgi:hypothetical protein
MRRGGRGRRRRRISPSGTLKRRLMLQKDFEAQALQVSPSRKTASGGGGSPG